MNDLEPAAEPSRLLSCRRFLPGLVLALLLVPAAHPQSEPEALARSLFEQERWQQLVDLDGAEVSRSADFAYQRGVALAHLERWGEAHATLLAGSALAPRDKRFPIELAGVAFKQKQTGACIAYLHRALRLDSRDTYANEFLATVYFLQGNMEAAVKYWNRVGKPQIASVRNDPEPRLRPALLDHALAFAPASKLDLEELRATAARVRALEMFPVYHLDLVARPDTSFDAVFRAQELNGFGSTWVEGLLRTFSGLPLQEVTPEYYNLKRSAINVGSMVRWDPDKRRLTAGLSGPLAHDPQWHLILNADLRNENWDVLGSNFVSGTPPLLAVNMRREAFQAELVRLVGARWKWSVRTELSHRDYRNVVTALNLPVELLAEGFQLKQTASATYEMWRMPEHRFTVSGAAEGQAARLWSPSPQSFEKLQGELGAHWFPHARGDDLETGWQLRAGRTFGRLPFDELFMLGLERDNDLWMRGHIGTRDGRKGSAPLGRNFVLANWETNKNVYSNGLITLKVGPLLDSGKITDPVLPQFGSQKWLWDTGGQLKVRVLGVQAGFSYGKDLRTGKNAFYAIVTPSPIIAAH